jgi:putative membrane protein
MLTTLAIASQNLVSHHFGGPGFGFGWLFLLIPLFWIGVVILIVALARRRWSRNGWGPGHFAGHPFYGHSFAGRSAEATLAERFAQGDIDEQEYRARLEVLRANNPGR